MDINLDVLADSLKNWYTWVVIIIAAVSGIIGGLAHKLTSPLDDKTSLWVYAIVGGVASLAVLYILSPPDGIKLIALSLAAGYAGKAVLDALEARVKTALAQADAARAKETGQKAIEAGKKAVSMAQKKGVKVRITEFNDEFVKGIHSIYNETPVRSGRSFPHYNDTLEKVRAENSTFLDRSVFLGAYYENELIGFTKIVFEDEFADILQHLSKMLHRDKNATNALMAKAVELCAARGAGYIAYGDWNDTNLSGYKRHNGFSRMDLPKYFIPLTWIGSVALRLKLHRPINQLLPAKTLPYLRELRRKWHEMQAHINTKFS